MVTYNVIYCIAITIHVLQYCINFVVDTILMIYIAKQIQSIF